MDVEPWTNVQVGVGSRVVAYVWEWADGRPHRLRVLRSRQRFAAHADEGWQGVGGQMAVYEGEGTSLRDAGLAPRATYFYTFFVRDGGGEWRQLLQERIGTVADDEQPRGKPLLGESGGTPGEGLRTTAGLLDLLTDFITP
jgi:hypothetical protein